MSQSRVHGVRHGSRRSPCLTLNSIQVAPIRSSKVASSEQPFTSTAVLAQRHTAQRELSQEFATLPGTGNPPLHGLRPLRRRAALSPFEGAIESVIPTVHSGHPICAAPLSQHSVIDPRFVLFIQSRERRKC